MNTLLLGQPGIGAYFIHDNLIFALTLAPGKSVYLTYCLLRRLVAGKSTIFSLSPTARYVFLDQGAYWVPDRSVFLLQEALDNDNDGLILYDINNAQGHAMDTRSLKFWDSIVALSPSEHRFKSWEKDNMATSWRFVMKTWSWSEVYLSR